ncbi:MAG: hypothetical protein A2038_15605 [Deltaproteobacteria bacterium GWA2_57_13]|nr:MAG: hypothetical protein A2038_15605 [Deltaproteobacteria bacterium GWA2_57_13]OGQ74049.1 MAG: hypothetical protein A3G40_00010 [Deltaproteobacteria bacterium RIFCSPLOWO2_12_FULL_57_22]
MRRESVLVAFLYVTGLAFGVDWAHAQTSPTLVTEASRMDQMASIQEGAKVIDKISAEFSSFLGSDAKTVVTGLRNGTPITLTSTVPGSTPGAPPVATTTTINPPTGKMGFGNVFISLALAKQQLGQLGITQPTPEQLQAALLGGSITTATGTTATTTNLQGILTMRSQNMGWGQIAQKLGFKLGPVVSGLKAANQGLAAQASSKSGTGSVNAAGGQPAGSSEGGIFTGSGRAVGRSGKGAMGSSEVGQGIVTGSGRPVGTPSGVVTGRGNAYGLSHGDPGNQGQGKSR